MYYLAIKNTLSGFCSPKCLLRLLLLLTFYSGILYAQNKSLSDDVDLMLMKEHYREAANTIVSSLNNSSGSAELYYKLGIAYQKQYLFSKAIEAYSKSVSLDTNLTAAYLSIGDCYIELGSNRKAHSIYEKVYNSDSTNIKAGLSLASILFDKQDYQNAFNVYKKISLIDSSNSYIYRQLGYCAQKLDTIILSNEYYDKALKLNENDMISLQQRINNLLKMKWKGNALFILFEWNRKDPDNSIINKLLGDTYFNDIKYDVAIGYYSKALKTGDTTAYLLQKMGISYYMNAVRMDSAEITKKDSCYRHAAAILEKGAAIDGNPVTYYYLATANQKLGNYTESIKYFNTVLLIAIPGIIGELYLHMSESYAALKDYYNEINSYKGGLLFSLDKTTLLLNIAEVYEKNLSDNASAVFYYKEYLGKDPQNNEINTAIKQKLKEISKKR